MSQNGHGHGANRLAEAAPPASAGISWIMWVFLTISLIIIVWQGSNVVSSAASGHTWPAGDATKVVLPPSHL